MFKFLLSIVLLTPSLVFAEGSAQGKVKGYVINSSSIFVSLTTEISNTPSCNTTKRFYFSQDSSYAKAFMAAILASYQAGQELILTGNGDCGGSNSEILRKICTLDIPC